MNNINNTANDNKSKYDLISRKATGFIYQDIENGKIAVLSVLPHSAILTKALQFQEFILELIENGKRNIIIDLSFCDYIDVSFLGAMVITQKKLLGVNGRLGIVMIPDIIFPSPKPTNIYKIFDIYQNLTDAIENIM